MKRLVEYIGAALLAGSVGFLIGQNYGAPETQASSIALNRPEKMQANAVPNAGLLPVPAAIDHKPSPPEFETVATKSNDEAESNKSELKKSLQEWDKITQDIAGRIQRGEPIEDIQEKAGIEWVEIDLEKIAQAATSREIVFQKLREDRVVPKPGTRIQW